MYLMSSLNINFDHSLHTFHACTHTFARPAGESDNGGVFLSRPPLSAVVSTSIVQLDVRVAYTDVHWRSGHVTQVLYAAEDKDYSL